MGCTYQQKLNGCLDRGEITAQPEPLKAIAEPSMPKLPKGKKKPVSDFLGVNQGGLDFSPLAWGLVGIGYGLYSGKNLKNKLGRAVLFAFVVGVSVPLIGRVGDYILVGYKKSGSKAQPEPVRKKIDPNILAQQFKN